MLKLNSQIVYKLSVLLVLCKITVRLSLVDIVTLSFFFLEPKASHSILDLIYSTILLQIKTFQVQGQIKLLMESNQLAVFFYQNNFIVEVFKSKIKDIKRRM